MMNPYPRKRQGRHVYMHRQEAEKVLGRLLLPGEVVHHVDGNKENNSPSNLIVFKNDSSHQLLHKLGPNAVTLIQCEDGAYLAVRKSKTCPVCGREFVLPKHAKARQRHCSKECGAKGLRKVQRPSRDELAKLVWSVPMTELSKRFGVSDKAIAKWCESDGIPRPPVGYWAKKRSLGD